ncbi:unnamed protein product [Vitrella brassicaformis CCMP3155]|uniref:PhoD-like phosphatase metallophosphatase domain-containing protein n=1 Tax=Vitrella brassicaformis (strain CCMP3155) TaxID=1169540 RepID=A0A0G4EJ55_VITBC|nr:unnamed protein product [Vitrella brassicaformis CCMP3155]|eukprot:CEL96472.1 unnamed protein product [Vitrella brassicaformis CCMP3155]
MSSPRHRRLHEEEMDEHDEEARAGTSAASALNGPPEGRLGYSVHTHPHNHTHAHTEPGPHKSSTVIFTPPPIEQFASCRRVHLLIFMTAFSIVTSFMTIFYVLVKFARFEDSWLHLNGVDTSRLISKIAFGSCLQYRVGPQPVWRSVMAIDPDTWIWTGDFVYMDQAFVDCHDPAMASDSPECVCEAGWIAFPSQQCHAGDLAKAHERVIAQLQQPDYQQFLRFMCPKWNQSYDTPIPGPDCHRPILGTYDDHDFMWNNGNRRLPNKLQAKNLFLDAVGEPASSPRRNAARGVEHLYVLNKDTADKRVGVYLLDERYYRDPLPCQTRRSYCQQLIEDLEASNNSTNETRRAPAAEPNQDLRGFCEDFLKEGVGCCLKDEQMFDARNGWCNQASSKQSPLYEEACDPTSALFGRRPLAYNAATHTLTADGGEYWPSSSFCEVLGPTQRSWLETSLRQSDAAVNLVVSSSVVLFNPDACGPQDGSYDNWECYRPAQRQLLASIARSGASCVVLLVGDFHWGDIKVLRPDTKAPYAKNYSSTLMPYPLYQVMASGLTEDIVHDWRPLVDRAKADPSFRTVEVPFEHNDPYKLRAHGDKGYVAEPHFGTVHIHWGKRKMRLQLRQSSDGEVAVQSEIHLSQCTLPRK